MAARITYVSSRANPVLAKVRKLATDPAGYRGVGELLLEGEHLCAAWLGHARPVPQAVVSEGGWADPQVRALAGRAEAVFVVADDAMARASALESATTVAFLVAAPSDGELRAGCATLVLDRVQDPGNVGNALRSAAAFGIEQVVALSGSVALWSPKAVRAGMGAHFALHLVESARDDDLDRLGVLLYGTSPHAKARLDDAALAWPCAWVVGSEGQGMSASVARRCAEVLRIAQPGGEESLNVAAAAAICFWESARQRDAAAARSSG